MRVELKAMEKPVSGTQTEYIPNLRLESQLLSPNHLSLRANLLLWLRRQINHPPELGWHTKLNVCHQGSLTKTTVSPQMLIYALLQNTKILISLPFLVEKEALIISVHLGDLLYHKSIDLLLCQVTPLRPPREKPLPKVPMTISCLLLNFQHINKSQRSLNIPVAVCYIH